MTSNPRKPGTDGLTRLLGIVEELRGPDGCPWDREQTLDTLKQYLIEESYETIDAIDSGDPDKHMEELGDVLLQIVLHSQIRTEEGGFCFDDVASAVADKLIRRHPHVFGDTKVSGSDQVLENWEAIKSKESSDGYRSLFEGIPRHLPALQKAQRVQSRASRVGFDWSDVADVLAKVQEELEETKQAIRGDDKEEIRNEIGDLLFAVVNLCRFQETRAEEALEGTVRKFIQRLQEVERRLNESGRNINDCALEEMDTIWEDIKREARTRTE